MSRVLIDTQVLIWLAEGASDLSDKSRKVVDDPLTIRLASVASVWEMAIKVAIGKLVLKNGSLHDFVQNLSRNEVALLPVLGEDAVDVATLPLNDHKDPFDRLIAAQCLRYNLTLLSVDPAFDQYGVRRVW